MSGTGNPSGAEEASASRFFGGRMDGERKHMREFSAAGQQAIHSVAQRHGFSPDAVSSMLRSVLNGHGRMAQFDHPEFGGAGQWMCGGMTMVSDMFNATLKARVERLCAELSTLVATEPDMIDSDARAGDRVSFIVPRAGEGRWWPAHLGRADSIGAQNAVRYAYFAGTRRLAIDVGGRITIYDTQDHRISGFSQQQSGRGSLTFSSQHGVVDVATLTVVSGERERQPAPDVVVSGERERQPAPDVVATIEKLAELRNKGILSDTEFAAKKAELLSRL